MENKKSKFKCSKCKKGVKKFKHLKKTQEGFLCKECYQEKRLKRRKATLDYCHKKGIIGIRRSKKQIKEDKKREQESPLIKSIRKNFPEISTKGLYITREEKQVLFWKYLKKGYCYEEADKKVKEMCNRMEKFVRKLCIEKKERKEMNRKFKEEFARLCMEAEL